MGYEASADCLCGSLAPHFTTMREFHFYDCSDCSLRFVSPRYPADEIYDSDYFHGAAHGFGFTDYEEDKRASDSYLNFLLKKIQEYKSSKNTSLLDVGAANGYFTELAKSQGFSPAGIEVSQSAVDWAIRLGRNVMCNSIEEYNPNEKFQVVTILDVLEHLEDPKSALLKIAALLNFDGLLVINVPDQGSLFARICRMKWHAYLPPEHWYYFNKRSLGKLLNDCGFTVLESRNLSKSFKVSYILQTVANSPQFPSVVRVISKTSLKILGSLAHRVQIRLPLFDNLYTIARVVV